MKQKTIRGFTIPELIITMGVAAIILSTAVPSVNTTIKNNRLATQVNHIITDLHFARSEAAKRDVRVILCRSSNPNASSPSCNEGSPQNTWTGGYLIFADDGKATNSIYDGSDILLRRGQPAPSGVRMLTNTPWNKYLEFNPSGSLSMKVEPPLCRSVTIAGMTMAGRSWSHSAASPGCTATTLTARHRPRDHRAIISIHL